MTLHEPILARVPLIDDRTREILDRRRSVATPRRRGWLVRRLLLLADVFGLAVAFLAAEWFVGSGTQGEAVRETVLVVLAIPTWVIAAKVNKLYDGDEERADHSTVDEFVAVFNLITLGTWLFFVALHVTGFWQPPLAKLVLFWAAAIFCIVLSRALARGYCRRQIEYVQNAIIVGAGNVGQLVARKMLQHKEYGINIVGFVDASPREPKLGIEHIPLLGELDDLTTLVELLDVERVVFAFSNDSHIDMLRLIRELKDQNVQIDIVPRLFEVIGPNVGVHTVEGMALIGLPALDLSRSSKLLKRAVDLVFASAGLIVFSPLLLLIALAVRRSSPGPVLFKQVRMGERDRPFKMFKFRTMVRDAEEMKSNLLPFNKHRTNDGRMFKMANDPRITRVGRVLRRYSLDELPQLVNVLRGEMSMVGPRPLVLDEDRFVRAWGRERLSLKPGVTGPWQVLGASEIPFEEMVKLDYLYVTGWSLINDLKLVFRTIPAIFRTRSAY
jgi:exopolysaccharide biosynthesis polyprenyl glycosylphosphotransferase